MPSFALQSPDWPYPRDRQPSAAEQVKRIRDLSAPAEPRAVHSAGRYTVWRMPFRVQHTRP